MNFSILGFDILIIKKCTLKVLGITFWSERNKIISRTRDFCKSQANVKECYLSNKTHGYYYFNIVTHSETYDFRLTEAMRDFCMNVNCNLIPMQGEPLNYSGLYRVF